MGPYEDRAAKDRKRYQKELMAFRQEHGSNTFTAKFVENVFAISLRNVAANATTVEKQNECVSTSSVRALSANKKLPVDKSLPVSSAGVLDEDPVLQGEKNICDSQKSKILCVGDTVQARYGRGQGFYPAIVQKINSNGTIDIIYDRYDDEDEDDQEV